MRTHGDAVAAQDATMVRNLFGKSLLTKSNKPCGTNRHACTVFLAHAFINFNLAQNRYSPLKLSGRAAAQHWQQFTPAVTMSRISAACIGSAPSANFRDRSSLATGSRPKINQRRMYIFLCRRVAPCLHVVTKQVSQQHIDQSPALASASARDNLRNQLNLVLGQGLHHLHQRVIA